MNKSASQFFVAAALVAASTSAFSQSKTTTSQMSSGQRHALNVTRDAVQMAGDHAMNAVTPSAFPGRDTYNKHMANIAVGNASNKVGQYNETYGANYRCYACEVYDTVK